MSRCSFITLSLLLIAYYYWSYQFFLAQPEPNNAALPLQVANQHHGSVDDSVKRELQLGQDGDAVKNAGAPRPDDRWEVDDNEPAAGQNRGGPDVPEDEDDDDRAALKDEDDDLEDDEKKPPPKKKKKPKKKKNKKKKQKHHEEEKPVEEAEEKPSDDEGDKPANKEDQQPNDDVPNNGDEEPPMPNSKEKLEVKEGNAVARVPEVNIEKQKDSVQKPEKEEDENDGDDKGDEPENEVEQHPNDQAPNDGNKEPPKPVAKEKLEVKEENAEARVPEVGIEKQKDAVQKPAQQEAEKTRGDGGDPEDKRPNNHAPGNSDKDPSKPEDKDKLEVKEKKAVASAPVEDVKKPKDAVQSNLRHMAVVSVTYFEKSQSYPPNTMVIVFTAAKKQNLTLQCWSSNGTHVAKPASVRQITKKDYVPKCRWNTHIATCQTATKPTEFGLIASNGSDVAKMPYREAVKQHYGVVGCFSPMFYSDRWQVLIALIDVYRQLGMDLQVFYVMSILKQIADYMKIYESLGHIRMEPWYAWGVKNDAPGLPYDPNLETEWRNQPGAHTDCLIHYRDSAEFILFGDIDEIMFPKLGKTFIEEFSYLTRKNPSARSFQYDRYNSIYTTTFDPKTFTITQLLNSTTILNEWSSAKAVVRPSRVESMWIHFPGWPSKKYKQVNVKPSDNFWVHFRKREGVDTTSGRRPKWLPQLKKPQSDEPFKYQMSSFFSANGALEIEKNFRDFVDKHAKLQYGMLTRKAYYYAEFEKCYREIFYDRETMADFCPTSLRCNISSVPGLQCTVAATKYEWKRLETDLVVHYPVEAGGYEIRENGC